MATYLRNLVDALAVEYGGFGILRQTGNLVLRNG